MKNNLRVKRSLIIQSFAPLFFLLTIKHIHFNLYVTLAKKFFFEIKQDFTVAFIKALQHPAFGGLCISVLGIVWLIITVVIALGFKGIHDNGFKSAGEQILIVNSETEGSAIFLVTYVLPLLTDDVSTFRGLIVFILILIMIILLLINSKVFYQNPILAILKYKTYSFKFINPDSDIKNKDAEYVCITRDKSLPSGRIIKRKHISNGVFLIYIDSGNGVNKNG